MNRIRELREAAGMSGEELAAKVGTSSAQIYKLERGERRLTSDWMDRIALALKTHPAELIKNAVTASFADDVVEIGSELDPVITAGMAVKGINMYRVTGTSVEAAGIRPGQTIMVEETKQAIEAVETGDIVLVELENPSVKVLRGIYITAEVTLLLTVRGGANLTISMDDPSVRPRIVGKLIGARGVVTPNAR